MFLCVLVHLLYQWSFDIRKPNRQGLPVQSENLRSCLCLSSVFVLKLSRFVQIICNSVFLEIFSLDYLVIIEVVKSVKL